VHGVRRARSAQVSREGASLGPAWVIGVALAIGWVVNPYASGCGRVERHPEEIRSVDPVRDNGGAGVPEVPDAAAISVHALQAHPGESLASIVGPSGRHNLERSALAMRADGVTTESALHRGDVRKAERFAGICVRTQNVVHYSHGFAHLVRVPCEAWPERHDEGEDVDVHRGVLP